MFFVHLIIPALSALPFKRRIQMKRRNKKLDLWRLYWPDDPTFLIRAVRFVPQPTFHGTHTHTRPQLIDSKQERVLSGGSAVGYVKEEEEKKGRSWGCCTVCVCVCVCVKNRLIQRFFSTGPLLLLARVARTILSHSIHVGSFESLSDFCLPPTNSTHNNVQQQQPSLGMFGVCVWLIVGV